MNLILSRYSSRAALLAVSVLWAIPASFAQTAPQVASVAVKSAAFESIAIHPGDPHSQDAETRFNPDGIIIANLPVSVSVYIAFFPQTLPARQLTEAMPAWASSERFNITAKVDESTAEVWKSLTPSQRQERVKPLLQALLADRFKLTVHRVPTEIDGFALVVSKGGPKLEAAPPDEAAPSPGFPLPEGGWQISYGRGEAPHVGYRAASVASLARNLSVGGAIVRDQTGLTGKYDFVVYPTDPDVHGVDPNDSAYSKAHYWDVTPLGLELKPIKVSAEKVIIDHIERPSEN